MHDQGEEEEQEAHEGDYECQHGFDAFFAADNHEQQAEEGQETYDSLEAVVAVNRERGEGACLAGHGDDGHAGLANRAEEQAVRAVGLDFRAVFEAQADDLVTDAAAVFLDIILQDARDRRFLEAAAVRIDEFRFRDLIELQERSEDERDAADNRQTLK